MRRILLLGLTMVSPGCVEATYGHADEAEHHESSFVSPEAAARVRLLESTSAGQPTEVLGIVDAHERNGREREALDEIRRAAAALGAEAVLGVEYHHGEGHDEPTHISGLAVRFRNLLRDEPYDVLERIEVRTDMDHEEQANDELRRRAAALHADLIIGVHYEHGEGGSQPVLLSGTAIRYRSSGRAY
jgi:uncharacterized protein YbjQ (UPF0145 family)